MNQLVTASFLWGRPYGGVAVLIKEHLRPISTTMISEERFCVFKIAVWILCNAYLPCYSTSDIFNICNSIVFDMWSYREQYPECECLIAGNMNINFDAHPVIASCINNFIAILSNVHGFK